MNDDMRFSALPMQKMHCFYNKSVPCQQTAADVVQAASRFGTDCNAGRDGYWRAGD